MRCSRPLSPRGVALTILLGVLLCAGHARAFCREVAATPPTNYDPALSGCFQSDADGAALLPLFWRNQCVSYSFQQQGVSPIPMSDVSRIAAQAFATWSNAPCPGGGMPTIIADPYSAVDCDNAGSNGHNNVILFRSKGWNHDASNAIGYTTLTISTNTGEILGANIEINSTDYQIVGSVPDGGAGGTYDLGSILTHEAGHFLGLAHSTDPNAVMYAHYHPGSTVLTTDDVAGICAIYSPDGTRSTGGGPMAATQCDPAPPLGFSSSCGSLDAGTRVGSGALPDAGAGASDPPCSSGDGCLAANGPAGGSGPASGVVWVASLVGAALVRRILKGKRARSVPANLSIVLVGAVAFGIHDAKASVSAAAIFEQLVGEASAAAVVTPVDHTATWEGGRIVTVTRVRVDRLVAGELPRDIWIETVGGSVGAITQLVEGEPTWSEGRSSLVFLDVHRAPVTNAPDGPFVVVERAQGQFPVSTPKGRPDELTMATDLGAIVPPPPDHWARVRRSLPPGYAPRYARDVLGARTVDAATRAIVAIWPLVHP